MFVSSDINVGSPMLRSSYQVIGQALFERFDKVIATLESWTEEEMEGGVAKEAVSY